MSIIEGFAFGTAVFALGAGAANFYGMVRQNGAMKAVTEKNHEMIRRGQEDLSKEHGNLSKEHGGLSKEHDKLAKELGVQLVDIKATTAFLKDEQLKNSGKMELLSKKELNINDTVNHIVALNELVGMQKQRIIELENTVFELKQQYHDIQKANDFYKERNNDWER